MLKNLLEQKKCFKLICGAGNENLDEIERLVALYASAGCRFFDLSASEEVLKAAQKGLDFAIPKEKQKDYHFCISIGTKNDQHMQKAVMRARGKEGERESCLNCGQCIEICPQKAIKKEKVKEEKRESITIIEQYCIGCGKCFEICPQNLISLEPYKNSACLPAFLPSCPLACIELHASDTDEAEVDEIWDYLNTNSDGLLSLCIGRGKLSDEQILKRVKRLVEKRKPYTTIIQADGLPMSGGEDDFATTRPAIETGELIQSLHLPFYLLLSGGTNSKTAQLAKLEGVDINGVGVGSFARKIVKEYIERDDFFTNKEIFNEACLKIKSLVAYYN